MITPLRAPRASIEMEGLVHGNFTEEDAGTIFDDIEKVRMVVDVTFFKQSLAAALYGDVCPCEGVARCLALLHLPHAMSMSSFSGIDQGYQWLTEYSLAAHGVGLRSAYERWPSKSDHIPSRREVKLSFVKTQRL